MYIARTTLYVQTCGNHIFMLLTSSHCIYYKHFQLCPCPGHSISAVDTLYLSYAPPTMGYVYSLFNLLTLCILYAWGMPSLLLNPHVISIIYTLRYVHTWDTQSLLLTSSCYVCYMHLPLYPCLGYSISVIDKICILYTRLSMSMSGVRIFSYDLLSLYVVYAPLTISMPGVPDLCY